MSAAVTNRVYLPNHVVRSQHFLSNKLYVSDDQYGDDRLVKLYERFGNLRIEACYKTSGKSLDDLKPFWTGTIKEYFS